MVQAIPRVLGDGHLSVSRQALYTCPERTRTIINGVTCVNAVEESVQLNIYLTTRGSPRRIVSKDLILKRGRFLETDMEYTLEPGDTIDGDCTRENAIEYTVSGIEHR